MQVLERAVALDDEKKAAVLSMLADGHSRRIIQYTVDGYKSAAEISAGCGIPISSVYRRLQSLRGNGLLASSSSLTDDGKRYFMYKSRVRSVSVSCGGEDLTVEAVPNAVRDRPAA